MICDHYRLSNERDGRGIVCDICGEHIEEVTEVMDNIFRKRQAGEPIQPDVAELRREVKRLRGPALAPDYRGMRCNGLRYLREEDPDGGYAYMRGEMARHLEEMASRYYAGDASAVDEFLQLYSIGQDKRIRPEGL